MPKPILVVAGTDFQDPLTSYMDTDYAGHGDYTVQTARTKAILTKIKEAYGDAYGFLAGGDYNFDEIKESEERTSYGVRKVLEAVTDVFGPEIRSVIVHGNHDAVVPEMSPSGANDTPYYGVFVMRENEYRSYPLIPRKWPDWEQSEAIAAKLAGELEAYLAEKAAAGYDKPVFIASHAPLHFNTRTKDKGDAIYADRFFAVIRQYAEQLNILFLSGHNHAWGDDDYLGGGSFFLTRGDRINIPKHGSFTEYTEETLNFTYLNYGYTGYYWSKWAFSTDEVRYSNADPALTMTAFLIDGDRVTVSRWDENGLHPLKSPGTPSQGNRGVGEVCPVTTNTYDSPQTV